MQHNAICFQYNRLFSINKLTYIATQWMAFVIVCLCLTLKPGLAADISVATTDQKKVYIQFIGEFKSQDTQKFKELAYKEHAEGVLFDSPGGDLDAGLAVGQTIRELGLVTLVPSNAGCFSACAIAWLGGSQRFMAKSSEVGFHAAYKFEGNKKVETGMGNALVGAYFTRIGLPEKAVAYLTAAPPDKLLRLTPDLAKDIGVNFTLIDDQRSDEMSPVRNEPAVVNGQTCRVADPSTTPLNIRNDTDQVIGTIANGNLVTIVNTKADRQNKLWAFISFKNEGLGWVYRKYLDCDGDRPVPRNTPKAEPTAGSNCRVSDPTGTPLNLRDTNYRVIGSMKNGTIVRVLRNGFDNSGRPWAFIMTPMGYQGWAYREYLSCYWR